MGWWSICRADEEMRPQVRKWTGNARQLQRWMREAGDRLCWRRESLRASGDSTDGGGGPGEHSWRGGAERQTVRIADGNHWCWLYWTVYKCRRGEDVDSSHPGRVFWSCCPLVSTVTDAYIQLTRTRCLSAAPLCRISHLCSSVRLLKTSVPVKPRAFISLDFHTRRLWL